MAHLIDSLLPCRTIQINTPIAIRIVLRTLTLSQPYQFLPIWIISLSLFLKEILPNWALKLAINSLSWLVGRSLPDWNVQQAFILGRRRFMWMLERLILIFG